MRWMGLPIDPGAEPHEMSAAGHEAAASGHEAEATRHEAMYSPGVAGDPRTVPP